VFAPCSALQRRRRHRAVPGAAAAAEGTGARAFTVEAAAGAHAALDAPDADRAGKRVRYLAEIAETVRGYKKRAAEQARIARERQQLLATKQMLLGVPVASAQAGPNVAAEALDPGLRRDDEITAEIDALAADRDARLDARSQKLLAMWPQMQQAYAGDEYVVRIRDREIRTRLTSTSLSGSKIRSRAAALRRPRRAAQVAAAGERAGVVPVHRRRVRLQARERDPTRMFAGEGDRSAPTGASSCCPRACRRSGCRPPSTA